MKILSLLLLITSSVNANVLKFNPSDTNDFGVTLNVSAEDATTVMPIAGFGLGEKKIGLSYIKICVNQFFVEKPSSLVRTNDDILPSIANAGNLVMEMSFLRAVDSALIKTSIEDAISNNISDEEFPAYEADINKMSNAILSEGAIYAGKTISFIVYPSIQTIIYYNSKNEVITLFYNHPKFFLKLFSIWLGNQTKPEGIRLKNALLLVPHLQPKTFNKPLFFGKDRQ